METDSAASQRRSLRADSARSLLSSTCVPRPRLRAQRRPRRGDCSPLVLSFTPPFARPNRPTPREWRTL